VNSLGEKIMAEQVLVPLKRNDRVEEIIPYVEKVTRPSMEVVFPLPGGPIASPGTMLS